MEKGKYSVIFYKDKRGRVPIADYMDELAKTSHKDARIKYRKVRSCIQLLRVHGTSIGKPYVKHLVGEIWELRPLKDRILFAAYDGNCFILLHYFRKETQKTPIREILQAKRNFKDYKERTQNEKGK